MKNEIIKMMVPAVGESINEVTISLWLKKDGDVVELDEVIAEIDSDKATFDLTAESSGKLEIKAQEGDTLEIGAHICSIEEGDFEIKDKNDSGETDDKNQKDEKQPEVIKEENIESNSNSSVTPVAKKIIEDKGIDIKNISGSGIGGKIIKEDVLNLNQESVDEKTESPSNQNRVKMTQLRKTIAKRLVSVKNETAMLTTFNEVDMLPIKELRSKYGAEFEQEHDVKLGYMGFFVIASVQALKKFPLVNASIDGNDIVYHGFQDIGVAVSTERGLVVPVIKDADNKSISEIEKSILNFSQKAKTGKLSIEEMLGGTFTISNGGVFGSLLSTPILNAPQTAILGMHSIQERPVAINGKVMVRPMMYLALSYDHRLLDGKEAVSFLVSIKEQLESPERLLLNL